MSPDHPTSPPGADVFDGRGMIVTIQVDDAAQACTALRRQGAPIAYDLHDEPWGQRRFMTLDPSGTLVDVVEQTEPGAGYWEKYMPAHETACGVGRHLDSSSRPSRVSGESRDRVPLAENGPGSRSRALRAYLAGTTINPAAPACARRAHRARPSP